MTEMRSTLIRTALFLFCAIPGLVLFLGGFGTVLGNVTGGVRWRYVLLGAAAMVVGIPLLFAGVGRWGQWRYLFVFLAIPAGLLLAIGIELLFRIDSLLLMLFFVAATPLTVEAWLRRRNPGLL